MSEVEIGILGVCLRGENVIEPDLILRLTGHQGFLIIPNLRSMGVYRERIEENVVSDWRGVSFLVHFRACIFFTFQLVQSILHFIGFILFAQEFGVLRVRGGHDGIGHYFRTKV
jgi:hypothetical protein